MLNKCWVLLFVLKHRSKVTYIVEAVLTDYSQSNYENWINSSVRNSVEAMNMSVLNVYGLQDVWRMKHARNNLENLIEIYQEVAGWRHQLPRWYSLGHYHKTSDVDWE